MDNKVQLPDEAVATQDADWVGAVSATIESGPDLTVWELVTDHAVLPGRPTPFSWSVVAPTLGEGYRRTFSQFNLPWPGEGDAFCLFQGLPYRRRGVSLGDAAGDPVHGGRWTQTGLASRGNKTAEALMASASDIVARTHRWYTRVQQTRWGQADLLQVMEEIENLGNSLQAARGQLGIIQRAAAARVQQWQRDVWPQATPAQIDDLTRHAGSYAEALALAGTTGSEQALADLVSTYGHRAANELELSTPRWHEAPPRSDTVWPTTLEPAWAGQAARQRVAEQTLAGRIGFLKRRGFEADVQWRQRAADLFDQVDDARARWLAGTRIWVIAAAHETAADGRITQADDIFLLELEEVKQLMTGEWNITHRATLHELVAQRRQAFAQ